MQHRDELVPLLTRIFRTESKELWLPLLEAAVIPCSPVNTMAEVFSNEQVLHHGLVQTVVHANAGPIKVVGHPVHYSESSVGVRSAPPSLGQHTNEVLARLL